MSVKHAYAGALLLAALGGSLTLAQPPTLPFAAPPEPIGAPAEKSAIVPPPDPPPYDSPLQALAPDAWIYQQAPAKTGATCCGPIGGHGPIGTEVYARSGPNFIIARNDLGRSLRTGWEVMGGGKSLFFHGDGDRAWVVDLGLSYTYNNGFGQTAFALNNEAVTIRNLHRTAVSLGLGHDWFLAGPGFVGGQWDSNLRWGIDGGARWGTAHLDLNPVAEPGGYRRVHDVFGGAFAGLHADYEVPMGAWTLLAGLRGEWDYTFLSILPGQNTRLLNINVLFTVGVRY